MKQQISKYSQVQLHQHEVISVWLYVFSMMYRYGPSSPAPNISSTPSLWLGGGGVRPRGYAQPTTPENEGVRFRHWNPPLRLVRVSRLHSFHIMKFSLNHFGVTSSPFLRCITSLFWLKVKHESRCHHHSWHLGEFLHVVNREKKRTEEWIKVFLGGKWKKEKKASHDTDTDPLIHWHFVCTAFSEHTSVLHCGAERRTRRKM